MFLLLLEDNYVTVLLVSAVRWNESAIRIHTPPSSWASLPLPAPHPTRLDHHRAPSWAPCAVQPLPTSCRFYTGRCVYVSATLSVHPLSPSLTVSTCPLSNLCLHSCPTHRFICTIFPDSTYMHYALLMTKVWPLIPLKLCTFSSLWTQGNGGAAGLACKCDCGSELEHLRRIPGGGVGLDGWTAYSWHRGCRSLQGEYRPSPKVFLRRTFQIILKFLPELCRHMFMVPGHHVWSAGKRWKNSKGTEFWNGDMRQGSGIFADLVLWEARVSGVSGWWSGVEKMLNSGSMSECGEGLGPWLAVSCERYSLLWQYYWLTIPYMWFCPFSALFVTLNKLCNPFNLFSHL